MRIWVGRWTLEGGQGGLVETGTYMLPWRRDM